jgi:hypothetical protein
LKSTKRHAKALSAHLENANRAWVALLDEAQEVTKLWPKVSRHRMPHAEVTGLSQLQQMVRAEIARLVCVANPIEFARIGSRHRNFLGIGPGPDATIPGLRNTGGADQFPTFEARMAQAGDNLLQVARASEPVVGPAVVPVSQVAVLPNKVLPADIPDLEALKAQHAADMAAISDPGPQTIDQLKEAWAVLQDPAEPELSGDELAAALAEWNRLNPGGEDADVLAEMQTATNQETTDVE